MKIVNPTQEYSRRQLVGMLYALRAIRKGKIVLASGKESEYYVDGRIAALHPPTLRLIGRELGQVMSPIDFDSIGCIEGVGSTVILGAMLLGYTHTQPISGFVIRKKPKEHGTKQMLEGEIGTKPILIDDVATSGKSLIHAINNMPIKPEVAVVLLDRGEGAKEALLELGVELKSILTMKDLII